MTILDKWIYFLKNLGNFDHIPTILNEPIFQKAFHIAELANLSWEQCTVYEQNLLDYWSMNAAVETAKEVGRTEGAQQKALEIARALKRNGLPLAQIVVATGLPMDAIDRL